MLVLIGLMGSGKTSVGRTLATRMNLSFADSDELVEDAAHASVRDIFTNHGEAHFRQLESAALARVCAAQTTDVLAVAGGAILAEGNRKLLENTAKHIVWLDAPTATLVGRTSRGKHRPMLDDDPSTTLNNMRQDREMFYRQMATHHIISRSLTIEQVVDKIVANCKLKKRAG